MGSKAEYEAKKAAKRAKRAAEEAAKRQAVIEGCVVKDVAAPAGDDQEIRYEASLDAETAAYEAALHMGVVEAPVCNEGGLWWYKETCSSAL